MEKVSVLDRERMREGERERISFIVIYTWSYTAQRRHEMFGVGEDMASFRLNLRQPLLSFRFHF